MSSYRLVFIHGFLEDASMWKHIIDGLTKNGSLVSTPELPGHGENTFIPEEKTAESYCQNILDQLSLKPEEKIFIIAHSMGGYLSATLASMIPEKIVGLCMFHSKAGKDSPEKIEDRKRAIIAATANKDLYVSTMINSIYYEANRERCKKEIQYQINRAKDLSIEAIVSAQEVMIQRPDQIEFMKTRNFSLFYFLGDKDTSLPLDVMNAEIAQLPGAVAYIAAETGHMGHYASTREALMFLQRCINISK